MPLHFLLICVNSFCVYKHFDRQKKRIVRVWAKRVNEASMVNNDSFPMNVVKECVYVWESENHPMINSVYLINLLFIVSVILWAHFSLQYNVYIFILSVIYIYIYFQKLNEWVMIMGKKAKRGKLFLCMFIFFICIYLYGGRKLSINKFFPSKRSAEIFTTWGDDK